MSYNCASQTCIVMLHLCCVAMICRVSDVIVSVGACVCISCGFGPPSFSFAGDGWLPPLGQWSCRLPLGGLSSPR